MTATEVEVTATAVHAPGTDLAPYRATVIEEYRPRIIMAPDEASELDKQLRSMMLAVLKENVDYGVIPGTGSKPTLLKPGAEKLLQWFGFGHETGRVEVERDGDGQRIGVTYRCTVTKGMADGRVVTVAMCEGYAGYDEDRFYTSAEDARAKAESKERTFARKDNRLAKPEKWENAAEYRAPWNSVIKMAQKRALVGAALQATSASTLFTQDMEDMRAEADGGKFTEAATAAVMALPEDIRTGLTQWYRGQKWPDPSRWTPEQWCAALQESGRLAERRSRPQPVQQVADAGAEPEAPSGMTAAEEWIADTIGKAARATTVTACRAFWTESAQKARAGDITRADATQVQEILKARIEDLAREAARAAIGDPDDPWAVKVDGLASTEEAVEAVNEVAAMHATGKMDEGRAARVRSAILARFPGAVTVQAAAA